MMVWAKIPYFVGGSAWDLFEGIKEVVRREPKRLNMGDWINMFPWASSAGECGTQGCWAGWMVLTTASSAQDIHELNWGGSVSDQALKLVPQSIRGDLAKLFGGTGGYDFPEGIAHGSPEYVKGVIRSVDKFMAKHERALRNHKLPGVRRVPGELPKDEDRAGF